MVDDTFSLRFSMLESNSQVDRCASMRSGNQREEPLHHENVVARDGIESSTFRFLVGFNRRENQRAHGGSPRLRDQYF
jgi:hypothetical protein